MIRQLELMPERTADDRGFGERIKTSVAFEKLLFEKLDEQGFAIAVNGTEHTHPGFVSQLLHSTDQTSLAIRFQPDGVACIGKTPRSFFIEAKAARNIEKTAYEQYMKLQVTGNIVIVVFEKLGWGWNFIEDIKMTDGHETVASFPAEKRFPVSPDGWIYPRSGKRWRDIKQKVLRASGTPYREIDKVSLLPWSVFKDNVITKLRRLHNDA